MEFSPEIKFLSNEIEITGIPVAFQKAIRQKVFMVIHTAIPSLSIKECLSGDDFIDISISGISDLSPSEKDFVQEKISFFSEELEKTLLHLGGAPSSLKENPKKRPIIMIPLPLERGPSRTAIQKFLKKLKKRFEKFKLFPTSSWGQTVDDQYKEFYVDFPITRLSIAAFVLEDFFRFGVYRIPEMNIFIRLVKPAEGKNEYSLTIGYDGESDDSCLPVLVEYPEVITDNLSK
jgi:hypothetical protein